MAAHVVAEPRSTSHSVIASYWHTAFILLVAGILAYRGDRRSKQGEHPEFGSGLV
jgi:hypothetical protein